MELTLPRRLVWLIAAMLLATLLLVATSGFVLARAHADLDQTARAVDQSFRLKLELERLLGRIADAEAAARGYAVSHSPEFAIQIHGVRDEIALHRKAVVGLLGSEPEHQQAFLDITRLIERRLGAIETLIHAVDEQDSDSALAEISITGKHIMDKLRDAVNEMVISERRVLASRELARAQQSRHTLQLGWLLLAVQAGLWSVLGFAIWRTVKRKALVRMCAWSRTIHHEGDWIPVEEYLERRFGLGTTHSMSPEEEAKYRHELDATPVYES